ncbi:MAG: hypothetical protein GY746_06170 [Gammaproteobacteria bacterium]|nr:hypothetical protein [Gammaproteobacteria bacterium]
MPTLLPLWRYARRVSSAASRLPGFTSLRFALHGWQRPKGSPKHSKDIRTLAMISENRNHISVSNSRYRGDASNPKEYPISKYTLFIWAGIRKDDITLKTPPFSDGYPSLTGWFRELHAVTQKNGNPIFFER